MNATQPNKPTLNDNEMLIDSEFGVHKLICWGDTAVVTEAEGYKKVYNVNRVDYHIRIDLERKPSGEWSVTHDYISRDQWERFNDSYPSESARRKIHDAILPAVHKATFQYGSTIVERGRIALETMKANTTRREIENLEKKLREQRDELTRCENVIRYSKSLIDTIEEAKAGALAKYAS